MSRRSPPNADAFSSSTSPRSRRLRHSLSSSVATQRSSGVGRSPRSAPRSVRGRRSRIRSANGRDADRRETVREHDVAEVAVGERAEVLRERLLRRAPHRLLERATSFQSGSHHLRPAVCVSTCASVTSSFRPPRKSGTSSRNGVSSVSDRSRTNDSASAVVASFVSDARSKSESGVHGASGPARSIRAQRPRGEHVDLAAALDAHDARGAERADRGLDDRTRGSGEIAQLEAAQPGPDRVAVAHRDRQGSDGLELSGEDLDHRAQRRQPAVVRADAGGDVRREANVVRSAQRNEHRRLRRGETRSRASADPR